MSSPHARSWAEPAAGATYELGRPDYPAALLDLLVGQADLGPGTTVLDVAAGTGKLTRLLTRTTSPASTRHPVFVMAVEPLEEMRREFRHQVPDVVVLAGTAEQLPLRDGQIDVVIVAQAFHWFDAHRAGAEFRRVLSPGGRLVLVENRRVDDRGMSGRLWQIMHRFEKLAPRPEPIRVDKASEQPASLLARQSDLSAHFVGWRHVELSHEQLLRTPAELEARFCSVSFVLMLAAHERRRLLAEIGRTVGSQYPVHLPLVTTVDIGRVHSQPPSAAPGAGGVRS